MRKRALAVAGAIVTGAALTIAGLTVAMVIPGAGTAASTATNVRLPSVDLSTDAAVNAYLRSIGVDPSTAVIQRGLNNYAGPNCPGVGWSCTTATNVVQIAQAGGSNKFECDPAFFGPGPPPFPLPADVTDASTNTCVIVQDTESGQNHARCFIHSSANPATLTCHVLQENDTGDNFFQGHQRIRQKSGAQQTGQIDLDLHQLNVSGNNHAQSLMQIFQSSSETEDVLGTPTQDQDGMFDADPWVQDTQTGNNFGHLTQELQQNGSATGPATTVQRQFSDQFGDIDQFAEPSVTILQPNGGAGFSNLFVQQSETQRLTGPGVQIQEGPQGCCGFGTQTGDEQQTSMKINQDSSEHASRGSAEQRQITEGTCASTGECSIKHNVGNDEDSISTSTDGPFLLTTCESSEFGGEGSGECTSTEGD